MRRYRFAFGVWDGGELNDDTPFRTSTWVSLDQTFFLLHSQRLACLLRCVSTGAYILAFSIVETYQSFEQTQHCINTA